MIQAVVDCADLGDPPPQELLLAWDCKRWGALPRSGGLYDQPARVMQNMRIAENLYSTVTKLRSAKGKEIHNLTDSERALIKYLIDEGILTNG
jgi:hypothetical protein